MKALSQLAALTLALLIPACIPFGDPGSPGAAGEISLDGIEVPGMMHLAVLMCPAEGDSFDPATRPTCDESESTAYGVDMDSFPFAYELTSGLGTSDQRDWRLVVWLTNELESEWIKSGEAYGTVIFEAEDCGAWGGYCDTSYGVDAVIDSIAP